MSTPSSPTLEFETSKCPVRGLINSFNGLKLLLGLKKESPIRSDSPDFDIIDWNTHCRVTHEAIFSQENFFEPLFQKLIHHARDRKAGCKEALLCGFNIEHEGNTYWNLLLNNILKELNKEKSYFANIRFKLIIEGGIREFERFFEQIVLNLFDQGKNWQEIEEILKNSHDSLIAIGMSNVVNNIISSATRFELNHTGDAISMCPFSGTILLPEALEKYKERIFTGCVLLRAKGIKGKTVFEDLLIVMAMIVYQYESWKKKHSGEIEFVDN